MIMFMLMLNITGALTIVALCYGLFGVPGLIVSIMLIWIFWMSWVVSE